MSINCRVSFKNNALEVVDKNGQPSKLYYDALELTGNEDKAFDLWYKAFSQEFTEQVKANNDDVTLDEVLKFVSANSSFRKSLDLSEVREIKDIMDKNSFSTLSSFSKVLNEIFRPDGITELNTRKAYESGLYDLEGLSEINLDEVDDLLDKIEGTLSRADIYVTPSSDTSANFIDTSKRTILGTPEFISQEEIEEEIISKVESTRDVSEISSLINNLPYSSFAEKFNSNESFKEQILKNIGAYTKVDTLFIEDDIATKKNLTYFNNLRRSVKRDNDVKSLLADVEYLEEVDDNVWAENQEEVKEVLKEIEERQFDENGIDVFGLSKFSSNKKLVLDTLDSLGLMIEKPTNENIFAFSEKFIELVPQPSSTVSEIIPESLEPFSNNVFKVHSTLSETELFRDHGLVKVGENLYHKIDLGKRSDLYEQLYQKAKEEGSPIYLKSEDKREGLRELEQYVMLQDSPLEKDVKEEHILNKLIFNHPKIQDTNDYSQLSDITTDPEYLVGGFPTDFSDYIVTEKQKDSQLYRSTLSKFRVGQAGIYLTSPVSSIEGIDFQKELEDYIRLSKDQSMKYLLPARPTNLKQDAELKAINDPLSVPVYSRQYSVDNGLLVTESTPNNNIRFYGKTYSKVAEDTKNSIFKQVPANPNNNFYSVNKDFITEEDRKVAAQVLNDAKFSFVDSVTTEEDFDNSLDKAGIENEVKFSIDLINIEPEVPTIEAAIDQLKQTGLANRVSLMTSEEISKQLEDIGIDPSVKKQLDNNPELNKEELAQDYFVREADRLPLTLSVFNRPEFVKMQGKVVNKISILNSLNQSGIKQIEKDLIKNVIEDYYKDQTKVSYDEVEATVRANIMPLEVLNTDSYSNYGMENLNEGDYGNANTIIFNSPIEHGVVGHFSSSFTNKSREKLNYVPKQLNNNTWVAVQEGYEDQANGNNIYQFVGTAGTKESVDQWISEYDKSNDNSPEVETDINEEGLKFSMYTDTDEEYGIDNEVVEVSKNGFPLGEAYFDRGTTLTDDIKREALKMIRVRNITQSNGYKTEYKELNKGMFGHIRVWTDGDIYNVAELQSDYFQNNNARKKALDRNAEYTTAFADKSDKLKTLREKRDSTIGYLADNGYLNVYERSGLKSNSEVLKALNSFGQEVGKRDGIEVVKFGLYYALSIDGELKTGNVYRTEELAEEQIKKDSEKIDFYKTTEGTPALTENEIPDEFKEGFNFLTKGFYTEEKNIEKDFSNTVESIIANLPLVEKQFIASQKEWEKRMVRESLRLASSSGASKLRLPTPHTLSVIEGYISGGGAPYYILSADNYDRLSPGDRIDYLGADSTVISSNRDEIEIVLSEDVIKYNIEDYINDELDYFTNEVLNYESGLDFENKYTEEEFNDADKHSSLDGVDLDEIAEKVEDDLYEISRDKVEQAIRDYFSIFYNEDNIESVLSDQGYENINVNGRFVYFTMRDVNTESLSQPDEYSDADKDTFSISDLTDTQQTVANKYVELAEILRKEVGEDNVETVTDDQGFDWYETDVEDKYSNKAVVAFKKGLSEKGVKPIVNGFVHNNDVYLNRDTITSETPIHEFNHLFTKWMKSNRPSLYNKGIALVKEELTKEDSDIASVIDYVQQTQPDLQGEKFFEEILTELTGREGADLLESGRKSGIIEWIRSFFKEIGNMLGILDATPEQVAKMTTREFAKSSAIQLLKGEDILSKMNMLKDSVANSISFPYEYTPVNDTVESVAEELRACN